MTGKGLNLFDECDARCVHLSPHEEQCASSHWWESKMCISQWRIQSFFEQAGTFI